MRGLRMRGPLGVLGRDVSEDLGRGSRRRRSARGPGTRTAWRRASRCRPAASAGCGGAAARSGLMKRGVPPGADGLGISVSVRASPKSSTRSRPSAFADDVRRLDVAVDHAATVRVLDRLRDSGEPFDQKRLQPPQDLVGRRGGRVRRSRSKRPASGAASAAPAGSSGRPISRAARRASITRSSVTPSTYSMTKYDSPLVFSAKNTGTIPGC